MANYCYNNVNNAPLMFCEGRMSFNLNRLMTFVNVVETGSFSRAAQLQQVPKSSISRQIQLLEEEVGTTLLYRTTRTLEVTDEGRLLFEKAKKTVVEVQDLLTSFRGKNDNFEGSIKITCAYDIGVMLMPKIIDEIQREYPGIKIQLILSNSQLDLVKESIDLAIRIGNLKDSLYKQKRIGTLASVVVGLPKYLKRFPPMKTLNDLNLVHKFSFGMTKEKEQWVFTKKGQREKIQFVPTFVGNDFLLLKEYVLLGNGICELPLFLAKTHLQKGELEEVLPDYQLTPVPINLVYPPQKKINPKIKMISDLILEKLQHHF